MKHIHAFAAILYNRDSRFSAFYRSSTKKDIDTEAAEKANDFFACLFSKQI